jgi:hypothetical protein
MGSDTTHGCTLSKESGAQPHTAVQLNGAIAFPLAHARLGTSSIYVWGPVSANQRQIIIPVATLNRSQISKALIFKPHRNEDRTLEIFGGIGG